MFLMTKLWFLFKNFSWFQIRTSYFKKFYFVDTSADEKGGESRVTLLSLHSFAYVFVFLGINR